MKKKLIALTLLAVATGALTASCSPADNSNSSAGGDDTSVTEVWATRVKITQPDTLIVGESFKISDIVVVSLPNATAKYSVAVTSASADVISLGDDNNTVTVTGAGTGAIQLKGQTGNVLGQINITAMTENGKALQEWCDGLKDNYLIDATWNSLDTVWAETAEGSTYSYTDHIGLLLTEDYFVDGLYQKDYSAIALAKDDGNTYGFSLLDAKGNKLNYSAGFKAAIDGAASVQISKRVNSKFLTDYFVMNGLLEVLDYTEGEDGWFTLNDGTAATDLISNMFGASVDGYTGVSAKVKLTNGVLQGVIKFDESGEDNDGNAYAYGSAIDFKIYRDVSNAVLESAVVDMEAPEPLDVSDLANHYAAFTNNYIVNWECGLFNSSYQTVSASNNFGTTLYGENSIIFATSKYADDGSVDLTSSDIGGYYTDETGLYSISLDETSTIVKTATSYTNITDVYNIMYSVSDMFTKEVLNNAYLTLEADTDKYQYYTYDGSFDNGELGLCVEELSILYGYKFYGYDDLTIYGPSGYIVDYGSYITQAFSLNYDGTNRIGYRETVYGAGTVTDVIGKKAWEAFPKYFTEPSSGGDDSSSGGSDSSASA